MENERDEIHVDGDFVTATTRDHTNDLTNGLMYIGGDFWSDGNAAHGKKVSMFSNVPEMCVSVTKNNNYRFHIPRTLYHLFDTTRP